MKRLLLKAAVAGAMIGIVKIGIDKASDGLVNMVLGEAVEAVEAVGTAIPSVATSEVVGSVIDSVR